MRLTRAGRALAVGTWAWAWAWTGAGVAVADMAVDPNGHTVYRTDLYNHSVAVVDGATGAVTATIPFDTRPGSIAVDPGTQTLYVASGNMVSAIDTATRGISADVVFDGPTSGLAVNPNTHTVYAGSNLFNEASGVSVIDGTTHAVVAKIPVRQPSQIAVDPGTGTVYATTQEICGNQSCARDSVGLTVVDGATHGVIATLPRLGPFVTVDVLSHTAYTANMFDDSVSVIDWATKAVAATIPVGHRPLAIAVDPGTQTVYALNGDDTVSVINAQTRAITRTVPVDKHAFALAVDPVNHIVYVESREGMVSTLPRG